MRRRYLLAVGVLVLLMVKCTYKKEAIAYPDIVPCDTSNVRYSVQVTSILSNNCYSCHATAVANASGGGNALDTYNKLKPYAQSGLLINVIKHTPGYDAMPKSGGKLSDCNINMIQKWLNDGMPNN